MSLVIVDGCGYNQFMISGPYDQDDAMSIVSCVMPGIGADLEPWYFALTPLGPVPIVNVEDVASPGELQDAIRLAIVVKYGDLWRALIPLRGMSFHSFSWN